MRLLAALALAGCGLLAPGQSVAQDAAGGLRLTFGLGLRLETDSNAALAPVSAGPTNRAITDLSFGLASATPNARFTLNAGLALQGEGGSGTRSNGLQNPFVTLSYGRDWADASFALTTSLRETDLSSYSDVTDFGATTGTRRTSRVDTQLRWGENRPLGFGFSAGFTDTRYRNAPGEADTTVARVGLTARLDLSKVSRLDLGLRASRYDEVGAPRRRDTLGFDAGFSIARPRGDLGLHLSIDDTPDGQRQSLTFRHSLALVRGNLAYGLGASRGVDDKVRLIGSLDYSLALPRGSLTFGLDHSVRADDRDNQTVITRASLGYRHELTPVSRLNISASWATSTPTATGFASTNASFGASYSHDLTPDWALDVSYRHRLRETGGIGKARSNVVFLGLRRDFTILR